MNHFQWAVAINSVGGLSDGDDEMRLAITGAENFCLDFIRDNGLPRNYMVEKGIPYIAAYMVSCAKNIDYEIFNLYLDSRDYRRIFQREAEKNKGILADMLNEAAQIQPDILRSFIIGAGLRLKIAPTGTGKGVKLSKQNSRY